MREEFPHKVPGDDLTAQHVNDLGAVAHRFARMHGSNINVQQTGNFVGLSASYPFRLHRLVIYSVDGGALYTVRRRYYDHSTLAWATDDAQDYQLDAADSELTYAVDDKVLAYWDEQRGAFVPMEGGESLTSIHIRTRSAGIPARVTDTDGSATCDVLNVTVGGVLTVLESRTIWNCSDVAVEGCKVGLASPVRTTTGTIIYVVVVESCTDVDLDSGGNCPDDGIADSPTECEAVSYYWLASAERWIAQGTPAGGTGSYIPLAPKRAGTSDGETVAAVCVLNTAPYCVWTPDGAGGWTGQAYNGCNCGSAPPYTGMAGFSIATQCE